MDGYMTTVEFDGQTLTAHGKNKAARIALAGEDHASDVVIPRQAIASVDFRAANPLVNGRVTVRTSDGRKVILHFRRKQQADFERLVERLRN